MAEKTDTMSYADALSLADSKPADFGVWVSQRAREYSEAATETASRMGSVTYYAAVATGVAVETGILKADRKASTQGMTTEEWAKKFGVTGSAYASRVTLWKRLALAVKAGVEADSETWRLLVAGDRANKNGVRQAIETGKLDTIDKAVRAVAAGQKSGLEESAKRTPRPNDGTKKGDDSKNDTTDDTPVIDFRPDNIVDAVALLSTVVIDLLGDVDDEPLVTLAHMFSDLAEACEAEGHKRITARKTAERKPAAGRKPRTRKAA